MQTLLSVSLLMDRTNWTFLFLYFFMGTTFHMMTKVSNLTSFTVYKNPGCIKTCTSAPVVLGLAGGFDVHFICVCVLYKTTM